MATLQTRLQDLAVSVATQIKGVRTMVNGNAGDLSALSTTAKDNLVAAINELKASIADAVAGSGALIDDAATDSTTETYSITKINDIVATAINELTTGAPAALDTLDELAAALADDANFAATMTAALASRVRTDTATQGLTALEQSNARTNINAYGPVELGNPDTDLVSVFNAGLV